ncbi:hypothetical protein NP493_43g01011 [Ridgeia piscesae]|uniref:Uncharacterized protein n=1 Tax=Ridgeia piscesae TaxID=27915 RepID=A0AAD9PBS0_RIDPI|nr:hypothetical protein NP493_43g01011 [Ridgeia piscesae]
MSYANCSYMSASNRDMRSLFSGVVKSSEYVQLSVE